MRVLSNNGFYGLLLMHMQFSLDENCSNVGTDGERMYFSPEFLDSLTDNDLDIVMMHEILHIALQRCLRGKNHDEEYFDVACDIVVNSNILASNNMNKDSITLSKYGELVHTTPDNKEGKDYTAEEIYSILTLNGNSKKKRQNGNNISNGTDKGNDEGDGEENGEGEGESEGKSKGLNKNGGFFRTTIPNGELPKMKL